MPRNEGYYFLVLKYHLILSCIVVVFAFICGGETAMDWTAVVCFILKFQFFNQDIRQYRISRGFDIVCFWLVMVFCVGLGLIREHWKW